MEKSPNAKNSSIKSPNERFLELTLKKSPYEVVFFDSSENCFLPKGYFFGDVTKLNFSLFCEKYISNLDISKLKNAYDKAASNENFAIDIHLKKYGTYSVHVKSVISRGSFQGVFFYFTSPQNLLSIFDELPFLCIVVDSNGLIRNVSKNLLAVLNLSNKSLISKHINDVISCDGCYSYSSHVNSNTFGSGTRGSTGSVNSINSINSMESMGSMGSASSTTSTNSATSTSSRNFLSTGSRNTKNDFDSIHEALNQQKVSISKKNSMKFYANANVFEYLGYTVIALEKITDNARNAKNFFGNIKSAENAVSLKNIGNASSTSNKLNLEDTGSTENSECVANQNDILYQSPIPYVVLDGFGKIEWFNDAFVKNIAPYGEKILGKMIGSWMKSSEMDNIPTNISNTIKENTRKKGMSFKLYSDVRNFGNDENGLSRLNTVDDLNGYSDKSNFRNKVFQFVFHGMVNHITTKDNDNFSNITSNESKNRLNSLDRLDRLDKLNGNSQISISQANTSNTTKSFRKSYFLFIVNDISQEEEKEKRIINAQKLQVIGQMALNISHDFRNILTSIGIACELLKDDMDNDMKMLSVSSANFAMNSNADFGTSGANYGVSSANQKLRRVSYERRQNDVISIRDSSSKAEKLVEQILSFSKQSDAITEKFSINQYLNGSKMMLNRLVGPKVHLEISIHDGNDFIVFNKSQFDQIVVNLIVNARDAINNTGKIRVSVNEVVVTRGSNQIYKLYGRVCGNLGDTEIPLGKYRVMSVTDNGCGIDKYVLSQMFKPFFSTKGNQGNGLGLATIAGILKSNGGYIAVHTEVNKGSKFSVFFRVNNNSATQNGSVSRGESAGATVGSTAISVNSKGGNSVSTSIMRNSYSNKSVHSIVSLAEKAKVNERVNKNVSDRMKEKIQEKIQEKANEKVNEKELRILVVDDNDSVRSFVSRVVETITPHVLNVDNGIEALNLAKKQKFDILLTDVEMNEMDGPELVKKMLEIHPNIEVIFLSGYSKDDLKSAFDSNLQSSCDYIFLPKPFGLKEIVSTIKNVAAKMNMSDKNVSGKR